MADGHKAGNGAGARQPQRSRVSQVESRVIFEREMGHTARPVQYDRTSALLLGWCPELDDTGVADEVCTTVQPLAKPVIRPLTLRAADRP